MYFLIYLTYNAKEYKKNVVPLGLISFAAFTFLFTFDAITVSLGLCNLYITHRSIDVYF